MSDLLDALNDAALYFDRRANSCRGTIQDIMTAGYEQRAATQRKAIAYLSSPLPDDVQLIVDALRRNPAFSGTTEHRSADMLERLARGNAAREKAYHLRGEEIVLLQAKIEELEASRRAAITLHLQGMHNSALQALQEDKE